MSLFLRQIALYIVRKAATDPEARENAVRVARGVVAEVKQIAREEDRAYAVGRSLRQKFDKLRDGR